MCSSNCFYEAMSKSQLFMHWHIFTLGGKNKGKNEIHINRVHHFTRDIGVLFFPPAFFLVFFCGGGGNTGNVLRVSSQKKIHK